MSTNNTDSLGEGVVIKKNLGSYFVRTDNRILLCKLSSRLHKQLIYPSDNSYALHHNVRSVKKLDNVDPIVVGDNVRFMEAQNGFGLILEVHPRRNRLIRRDPHSSRRKFEQVMAANVDYVIPVCAAASPTPKWSMLDRYLVSAEALELSAMVVISKIDLLESFCAALEEKFQESIYTYRRIGYLVVLTSSFTGEGLDELRTILKGHTSIFVGKSGVGKTALLNALELGLNLRIGAVGNGRIGKGKHTTSSAEMIRTAFGANIVDSPGMREFGLHDLSGQDPAWFFPEMRPLVRSCRFGLDCSHDQEPGCAIRTAVMAGEISPLRYRSYLRIKEED